MFHTQRNEDYFRRRISLRGMHPSDELRPNKSSVMTRRAAGVQKGQLSHRAEARTVRQRHSPKPRTMRVSAYDSQSVGVGDEERSACVVGFKAQRHDPVTPVGRLRFLAEQQGCWVPPSEVAPGARLRVCDNQRRFACKTRQSALKTFER